MHSYVRLPGSVCAHPSVLLSFWASRSGFFSFFIFLFFSFLGSAGAGSAGRWQRLLSRWWWRALAWGGVKRNGRPPNMDRPVQTACKACMAAREGCKLQVHGWAGGVDVAAARCRLVSVDANVQSAKRKKRTARKTRTAQKCGVLTACAP